MTQEIYDAQLNKNNVEKNVYISLIVANVIFGVLHPEHQIIAAAGAAFFAGLMMKMRA